LSAKNDYFQIRLLIQQAAAEKAELKKELRKEGLLKNNYSLRQLVTLAAVLEDYYESWVLEVVGLPNTVCKCKTNIFDLYEEEDEEFTSKDVDDYVEVSTNYVQVGTKFLRKNPKDKIVVRV
jgi:hypothetical protein